MWSGTMEEYFKLYSTTAKYLKKQFPEIKVGGYASCGFYSVTRQDTTDFYKGFLRWFDEFLIDVKKENAPLDFYSWHLYTTNLDELIKHAEYVAMTLKKAGFYQTENIFDEWNFNDYSPNVFDKMKESPTATFVAAAFCLMQDSPIDKAMYYDADPSHRHGGLFYFPSERVTPTYYAFKAFNELYKLGNRIECRGIRSKNVFTLGAADEHSTAVLLVNRGNRCQCIELETAANLKRAKITLLDKEHVFVPVKSLLHGCKLTLPKECFLLLNIPLKETTVDGERKMSVESARGTGLDIAGLDG